MNARLIIGDCVEAMSLLPPNSIDAIVTDPPYGLSKEPDIAEVLTHWLAGDDYKHRGGGFMGKTWDSFVPGPVYWKACLRVLKPGGHLLTFGGTRTFDMLGIALRLSGFEVRDTITWLYGSGFPKSMDVSKAIDKAAGVKRDLVKRIRVDGKAPGAVVTGFHHDGSLDPSMAAGPPVTAAAGRWQGWGTALKPGYEPIIVARKPLVGTVAANVLKHGTGALNIDGCRVGSESTTRTRTPDDFGLINDDGWAPTPGVNGSGSGRWPANVILSHAEGCEQVGMRKVKSQNPAYADSSKGQPGYHGGGAGRTAGQGIGHADADGMETVEAWRCVEDCPVRMLDAQTGDLGKSQGGNSTQINAGTGRYNWNTEGGKRAEPDGIDPGYGDSGGASRFFYTAKASTRERNAGLGGKNAHPTVKPIALMRYLVRLVTPPGGTVLDPFMGSGTTGCAAALEGFDFVGLEREKDYVDIARARIEHWSKAPADDLKPHPEAPVPIAGQLSIDDVIEQDGAAA